VAILGICPLISSRTRQSVCVVILNGIQVGREDLFSVVLVLLMIITEALRVFYNNVIPKTKLISVSFYVTLTFWSCKTLDETSYSCQTHVFLYKNIQISVKLLEMVASRVFCFLHP
jgi:hypothetical protein